MASAQPIPFAPDGPRALEGLPDRIVLFDGVCVVCERSVDWLMRRDRSARLRFAPLQGETAAQLRAAFPGVIPRGIDTMVYFERTASGPKLWLRSRAIRRLLEEVGGGLGLTILRILPTPIADLGYAIFARLRYRVFGRRDACRVPTADERVRFLP